MASPRAHSVQRSHPTAATHPRQRRRRRDEGRGGRGRVAWSRRKQRSTTPHSRNSQAGTHRPNYSPSPAWPILATSGLLAPAGGALSAREIANINLADVRASLDTLVASGVTVWGSGGEGGQVEVPNTRAARVARSTCAHTLPLSINAASADSAQHCCLRRGAAWSSPPPPPKAYRHL